MTISTAPLIYRFAVDAQSVVPLIRQMPPNVAVAHVHLGIPPYHQSNEEKHTTEYVEGCLARGVIPFAKCTLTPDLGRNILLPELEPIKFRSLNDRCPIHRDLQTRINHAVMQGGKINEARFSVDTLHWNDEQRKMCLRMFQDSVKCWLDKGYELTAFKLGYEHRAPPTAMSMARDDSYGMEVRLEGNVWLMYVKPRAQNLAASKHIETILHKHGLVTTQVIGDLDD